MQIIINYYHLVLILFACRGHTRLTRPPKNAITKFCDITTPYLSINQMVFTFYSVANLNQIKHKYRD